MAGIQLLTYCLIQTDLTQRIKKGTTLYGFPNLGGHWLPTACIFLNRYETPVTTDVPDQGHTTECRSISWKLEQPTGYPLPSTHHPPTFLFREALVHGTSLHLQLNQGDSVSHWAPENRLYAELKYITASIPGFVA